MDINFIFIRYAWASFLAIGPILGYIPQYIDIKKTKHYQGFSSIICFILLTSNILRILSYLLDPFDKFLLLQSIFMVIVQLLMLHLIVKLSSRDILYLPSSNISVIQVQPTAQKERNFITSFWAWKSFFDYLIFLFLFIIFFTFIVFIEKFVFPSRVIKVLFIYTSTLIESTLCMPQVLINWRNGSTQGLNKSLVGTWIFGDLFKLSYYFYSKSPMPFKVCAIIQLSVDVIIISQIMYYKFSSSTKNKTMHKELARTPSAFPLKDETFDGI